MAFSLISGVAASPSGAAPWAEAYGVKMNVVHTQWSAGCQFQFQFGHFGAAYAKVRVASSAAWYTCMIGGRAVAGVNGRAVVGPWVYAAARDGGATGWYQSTVGVGTGYATDISFTVVRQGVAPSTSSLRYNALRCC